MSFSLEPAVQTCPQMSRDCVYVSGRPLGLQGRNLCGVTVQDVLWQAISPLFLQYAFHNYWWSHREGGERQLYQNPILG